MNTDIPSLAADWSAAIDSYESEKATLIAQELIPLLIVAHAVDRATAIQVGGWVYWARSIGRVEEVAREAYQGGV